MKQLTRFAIRAEERSFILSLEDDDGQTVEMEASPEQLDAVIDALDDLLGEDEEEVFDVDADDEDVYQKPLG